MSNSLEIENYFKALSSDRQEPMRKLHEIIISNLPKGFETGITYKMIGYFVPHSIYPAGYPSNPKQALPFMRKITFPCIIWVSIKEIWNNGLKIDMQLIAVKN